MTGALPSTGAAGPGERAGAGWPVAIVGAGPVGMAAALALARHGVRSVVLEARPEPSAAGSRSICTQGDVLAVFERLGCGREMLDRGVRWTLGRTYFRDVELFSTRLPAAGGQAALPPFVNLGQHELEALLLEHVGRSALAEVRWAHEVTDLHQDGDGVTLTVATPSGRAEVDAPYAIACDGPRSRVRERLGVEMPGHSFPDRFLIADVRADLPFPEERRFFFDPPFNPGRQVLVHPQPGGVWRIDWQVPPGTDVEEERRSGRLDERIRAVIGDRDYELVWLSSYRFHQRVAERFRAGRLFLAGDAAHLMAPFGARGLNSGVADVDNLAWKLTLVLTGAAPDALLDSYDSERREAALHHVGVVGRTMRFMTPPNRARLWLRDAILRGSLRLPPLRRLVDSGRLYRPHAYRRSPIVLHDDVRRPPLPHTAAEPPPGAALPDAACLLPGGEATRLRHLVGQGFLALCLPPGARATEQVVEAARVRTPVPLSLAVVPPPGAAPHRGGTGVLWLGDPDGALRAALAPGGDRLYLVRPDGHIAARGRSRDAARLPEWLRAAIAAGP